MRNIRTTDPVNLTRRDFFKVVGELGISAAAITSLQRCGVKLAVPTVQTETLETTTIRPGHGPRVSIDWGFLNKL